VGQGVIEFQLYGARVVADVELFERADVPASPVSEEWEALRLAALPDALKLPELPRVMPVLHGHGRELWLSTDRLSAGSEPGQPWQAGVRELLTFSWRGGDSTLYYRLEPGCRPELLAFWFVHTFLPLYLALEYGYDFIHAAAVEMAGRPILFIAPSGGGKSTLGDYFLRRGHPMLSDDKVAVFLREGRFHAAPSYPFHRPFRQFETLGHPVKNFASRAMPIQACYALHRDAADAPIVIEEIEGFRKLELLMPNYMFDFPLLQERRLRWLGGLVDRSPVFRVSRPWGLEHLQEVYQEICLHSQQLGWN
jgi:hypothetical protein